MRIYSTRAVDACLEGAATKRPVLEWGEVMCGMEETGRLPDLFGRTRECAQIDALLAGAREGRSGALVVRGDAGMGKTALLRYATERASAMRVLQVTGVEAESDLAFAGLHALARPVIANLAQVPEPQRAAVAAALGLATGEGSERFLVSAGVLSLLAAAAEAGPLLCTVDDAQWLDVPSADSLMFAARARGRRDRPAVRRPR